MAVDRVLGNDSFVILILPEWATIDANQVVLDLRAAIGTAGGVLTFNGRSGVVIPLAGDYTAGMGRAVALTCDSQEMSTSGIATGLSGTVLVEVLAVKTGTTGTANLVGQRRLDAFQI